MDSATLVAVSSLGGVFLGVLGSVLTTWMTKRYEDRRHLRELALNLGLENYKIQMQEAERNSPHRSTVMPPLDDFIVHMLCVADLLDRKGARADNNDELLRGIRQLAQRASRFYDSEDPIVPRRTASRE